MSLQWLNMCQCDCDGHNTFSGRCITRNIKGKICEDCQRKCLPTKHAPDVVESAASVGIFPASEVSASEAESTPATTQVM